MKPPHAGAAAAAESLPPAVIVRLPSVVAPFLIK